MPRVQKSRYVSTDPRVEPPPHLSEAARAIFEHVVSAVHPDHFNVADVVLLEQYATSCALAAEAAQHLDAEGPVVEGKPSAWLAVFERAAKVNVALCARLRLSPQSRFDRLVAGTNSRPQPASRPPWLRKDEDPESALLA